MIPTGLPDLSKPSRDHKNLRKSKFFRDEIFRKTGKIQRLLPRERTVCSFQYIPRGFSSVPGGQFGGSFGGSLGVVWGQFGGGLGAVQGQFRDFFSGFFSGKFSENFVSVYTQRAACSTAWRWAVEPSIATRKQKRQGWKQWGGDKGGKKENIRKYTET